jgi:CIC family chloride channel protein
LAVAISYGVRRSLIKDSIYTRKLSLRGDIVPDSLQADIHFSRRAETIMNRHFEVLPMAETPPTFRPASSAKPPAILITNDSGKIIGVVTPVELAARETSAAGTSKDYITVATDTPLRVIIARMRARNALVALVTSKPGKLAASDVRGVITRQDVLDMLADDMELYN